MPIALTREEFALVERYAARQGVSLEAAVEALASAAVARQVRRRFGATPSAAVRAFHKKT